MPNVTVCREAAANIQQVHAVNAAAFGRPDEAELVERLRAAGAVLLSLVAIEDGQVVGHILFSPVTISSPGDSFVAAGLGPMAVLPEHQRRGIGSAMVRSGLAELRCAGHETVVVLGHPDYYPRFGFEPASQHGIRWERDCRDEAFMIMELVPGALRGRNGVVRYRPEFDEV